ncbi:uncharacterized protein JCM15063_000761 [Sporobolomyces koalae]|uniref:uncharacterized protein n=1 Tax=Sporobolomyces koalae TaxID=500713 RepID=UPI00316DBE03
MARKKDLGYHMVPPYIADRHRRDDEAREAAMWATLARWKAEAEAEATGADTAPGRGLVEEESGALVDSQGGTVEQGKDVPMKEPMQGD